MEYILIRPSENGIFWKYFNDDVLVSSGILDLSSYEGGEVNLSDDLFFDNSKGFYKKDGDNVIYLVVRINYLSKNLFLGGK